MFKQFILSCFFILTSFGFSQELPPIDVFTPQDYGAEDQNWAISQASTSEMYFANNKGLLEYNGERWTLYPTPNESILRSVKVINEKIYTGFYMDFGFWKRDEYGKLNYTSLVSKLNIDLIEDEQFWNIVSLDGYILFQSLNRIYILNTQDNSYSLIESQTTLIKVYKLDDLIYFQKFNEGIYVIENGKEKLIIGSGLIKDKVVTNIFKHDSGLLIQTKENGFYSYADGSLTVWNQELNDILFHNSIYSSLKLRNGDYLLGTVSHGVILLDEEGIIKSRIDQSNGLSNNTVLSMFEDARGNIWLGLDNGINVINLNSPFRVFNDDSGILGTVYTSIISNNKLYLGSNQGLFYKELGAVGKFNFIEGTEGQVWCLQKLDDTLFCGHDKGTFVIDDIKANLISDVQGAWQLQRIASNPNLFIQGNYNGLNIFEKEGNQWQFRNKLEGFDISSRYFEIINNNEILVSHEYKGVFRLNIGEGFTSVKSYEQESIEKGEKSSLVSYNGDIFYSYKEGVYAYNSDSRKFVKDTSLSKLINSDQYTSGRLINDDNSNKLWLFSENNLNYAEPEALSSNYKVASIALPGKLRKTKAGYENLLATDKNKYLLGATNGYIEIDFDKIQNNNYEVEIHLNEIQNYALNQPAEALSIETLNPLPNKSNNISFSYSVTNFDKFSNTKYKYRLVGFNDNWSSWMDESSMLYENLPYGNYTFEAKAKIGDKISENTVSYSFEISKPWFLKPLAIFIYVLILLMLLALVHWFNQKYYEKQHLKLLKKKERELEIKELENQKQLMQFNNKNLQQDIDNKNRELGMSTMNLINKNELLNEIKKELSKAKKLEDLKSVIKLINKNLNTTDDWKLFEEAFNNADKDFLKNLKQKHPELTSNDLRLCTYLRLNLSSKEIAPLLNISPRSVEVKRYRLRKKMNLHHDTNLTNYILKL
ncbi:triple tyrosine motif-containing protein [Winogradskyella sp. SYSU M77433]|uniref:helix-turn-helix and ligand-binding sensor domain-containing protein n=1 Tax=Winogradskyella sp. SYSU M77433 TaxID=3042722 RepID=UPI002480018B|nr:triple tyrosine motif-containing protein [Winogradskyella sp. SYSU M77433]MDH7911662.1 triple tyrosine motif-containing protein [Winogradskyella sp. SYSU M77433]